MLVPVFGALLGALVTGTVNSWRAKNRRQHEKQLLRMQGALRTAGSAREEMIGVLARLLSPFAPSDRSRVEARNVWQSEGQPLLKAFDLNQELDWKRLVELNDAVREFLEAIPEEKRELSAEANALRLKAIGAWHNLDQAVTNSLFASPGAAGHRGSRRSWATDS